MSLRQAVQSGSDPPPVQKLPAGSAFYEPAGKVIARFDNASPCEKMRFICYYLLEGKQELIEMLAPATQERERVFIADQRCVIER